ncbi:MAG: glycosyltransferase [Flavisolibacter sp.]|nr:glycosyltransferase [Flavisolibacter sp.]
MIRICTSLQKNGYTVLLVGRKLKTSLPLSTQPYKQKRLSCFFEKGKVFYVEYNVRLFFFLLFQKSDLICAIDLDTIVPCYFASVIRRKKRVYDAHELFCEMKEVVTRPSIYKFWKRIEKFAVPKFRYGYTVNHPIQKILNDDYKVSYEVIMNVPFLQNTIDTEKQNFIIYQGAVNHGRSFETLIPAFQWIDCPFWIYGNGNFYDECKKLIEKYALDDKVILKGKILPHELKSITSKALMGITLFENNGLNNYYSLGNRFFDYIQAGIPQVCVDYPAYKKINEQFEVAVLIDDLSSQSIAKAINSLLNDDELQDKLRANCLEARKVYNWQNEEKKLLQYYQQIF